MCRAGQNVVRDRGAEQGGKLGRPGRSARSLGVLVALVAFGGEIAGCASGGTNGAGEPRVPAGVSTLLVPSGPAAQFYGSQVEAVLATDGLFRQIANEIEGSRRRHGQSPLVHDGRLDRVARDVARATDGRRAPSADSVAFLMWHYGVVEPEPNLFLLHGDDGAEPAAVAALASQIAAVPNGSEWRRLGIGVERSSGQWNAVVVLAEKQLDIDPVPRNIEPGRPVPISGRIRPALHSPEILVTPPSGPVKRSTAAVHRDGFSARLDCDRGLGVYQVEISAQDARGPRVLANFPVYCGVEAPRSLALSPGVSPPSGDAGEAERVLLDLLDRDRRAAGLPPLLRDPRLAAVARRYSREMAETGEVAHLSARTGSVIDRVRGAGVAPPPTILAENVGSAASAADAERAFMGSPGHRDNILNPDVTHVGVGVAAGPEQGGSVPLYFTQIFAGWGK
jgi:uncharacterized protein YkwD